MHNAGVRYERTFTLLFLGPDMAVRWASFPNGFSASRLTTYGLRLPACEGFVSALKATSNLRRCSPLAPVVATGVSAPAKWKGVLEMSEENRVDDRRDAEGFRVAKTSNGLNRRRFLEQAGAATAIAAGVLASPATGDSAVSRLRQRALAVGSFQSAQGAVVPKSRGRSFP